MLHTDVDALLDDSVSDLLVDFDTHSTAADVEHDTCAAMVELVGHTLVEGTIHCDVHVVTRPQGLHKGLQSDVVALLTEGAGEGVAGATAVTVGVTHLELSAGAQGEVDVGSVQVG